MRIYNRQFYVIFRCEKERVKIVISESNSVCSFINLYVTLYENKIKCCCFCLENHVQLNSGADAVNFFDLNMTRNKFFPMKSILRKKKFKNIWRFSEFTISHQRKKRAEKLCRCVTTSQFLWRVTWSEASNTIWWHNNVKNTHMQRDNSHTQTQRQVMLIHEKKWREATTTNTHTRWIRKKKKSRLSIGALCGHIKHFKPNIFLVSPAKWAGSMVRKFFSYSRALSLRPVAQSLTYDTVYVTGMTYRQ